MPSDLAGRCHSCWMLADFCICEHIAPVATRTPILLIRHAKERWRATNTARVASLALPRLELVDYGVKDQGFDASLIRKDAVVLFPGGDESPLEEEIAQLVVLDGSWRQAKRLLRRLGLRGHRRLSLPPPAQPLARLRRAAAEDRMSTLEAIAEVVRRIDGEEPAETLRELHRKLVRASYAGRGHGLLARLDAE